MSINHLVRNHFMRCCRPLVSQVHEDSSKRLCLLDEHAEVACFTRPLWTHWEKNTLSFCQAVDLNIDEDTLMKLAPFYRTSLAPSTGPSRLIYYERFEIHPIKVSLCLNLCYFYRGWVKYSLIHLWFQQATPCSHKWNTYTIFLQVF